jgi:hypothetical protein
MRADAEPEPELVSGPHSSSSTTMSTTHLHLTEQVPGPRSDHSTTSGGPHDNRSRASYVAPPVSFHLVAAGLAIGLGKCSYSASVTRSLTEQSCTAHSTCRGATCDTAVLLIRPLYRCLPQAEQEGGKTRSDLEPDISGCLHLRSVRRRGRIDCIPTRLARAFHARY